MLHSVVIALGSNYHPIAHIRKARRDLSSLLSIRSISRNKWTEAIGMVSPRFLNCILTGTTRMTTDDLLCKLKALEQAEGDSAEERRQGRVHIDIDLLRYDETLHHPADWQRDYINTLYNEIKETP